MRLKELIKYVEKRGCTWCYASFRKKKAVNNVIHITYHDLMLITVYNIKRNPKISFYSRFRLEKKDDDYRIAMYANTKMNDMIQKNFKKLKHKEFDLKFKEMECNYKQIIMQQRQIALAEDFACFLT